ncbi:MAG: hypothetical protein EXR47_07750 [Dehalococcoidia bacterium]|nr:hypothetical protein [Dehalococcoidia bacterium]
MATLQDVRKEVRKLVDKLPVSELEHARRYLEFLSIQPDPVRQAILNAPLDDEPVSEEDRVALRRARKAVKSGRVVTNETLKYELGL